MQNMKAELSMKNKWYLSKHEFYTAYHYALQYNAWKDERRAIVGVLAAAIDGMPHGNGTSNPTESQAIRLSALKSKIDMVESTALFVSEEMYPYLLKAVTNEKISFIYLQMRMQMPFSKRDYYEKRREFYYRLYKKLEKLGTQVTV